jgi:hypothetical protein
MKGSLWIFVLAKTNPHRLPFIMTQGKKAVLLHLQKSFLGGRTPFEIAAETVKIGSFTTWLSRRFIATLHSK